MSGLFAASIESGYLSILLWFHTFRGSRSTDSFAHEAPTSDAQSEEGPGAKVNTEYLIPEFYLGQGFANCNAFRVGRECIAPVES